MIHLPHGKMSSESDNLDKNDEYFHNLLDDELVEYNYEEDENVMEEDLNVEEFGKLLYVNGLIILNRKVQYTDGYRFQKYCRKEFSDIKSRRLYLVPLHSKDDVQLTKSSERGVRVYGASFRFDRGRTGLVVNKFEENEIYDMNISQDPSTKRDNSVLKKQYVEHEYCEEDKALLQAGIPREIKIEGMEMFRTFYEYASAHPNSSRVFTPYTGPHSISRRYICKFDETTIRGEGTNFARLYWILCLAPCLKYVQLDKDKEEKLKKLTEKGSDKVTIVRDILIDFLKRDLWL
ncbi:hypothetical protein KGF56_002283, partial [Candida oxycetoniae]